MNNHDELDEPLEDLIIHTANEYGGFEGFDDEDSRDGFNKAKQAIQSIIDRAVLEKLNYIRGFGERGGHDVYCRTIGEALLEELESQGSE